MLQSPLAAPMPALPSVAPDLALLMQPLLPQIQTNKDLQVVLEMKSVKMLTFCSKNKSEHYTKLTIPKHDGTLRTLYNPDAQMRAAQYRILTKLLNNLNLPDYVYAFERNKNIPSMAAKHVGKHCIISLDIKDFFHSIKQHTVFNIMQRLGLGDFPARTVSELCTYKAFVPQGALTSPKISNLVTSVTFGPEIQDYCREHQLVLTIYADDVVVSSDNKEIDPKEIIQDLTRIITSHGFRINKKKTKVMFHGSRQYVCGAVVNAKVNLIVKERKRLRAIIHNITKNGIEVEAVKSNKEPAQFLNYVRGRVNWFRQLNSVMGKQYFDKLKAYLETVKAAALEEANLALLYKHYMEEAEKIILDGGEISVPW